MISSEYKRYARFIHCVLTWKLNKHKEQTTTQIVNMNIVDFRYESLQMIFPVNSPQVPYFYCGSGHVILAWFFFLG